MLGAILKMANPLMIGIACPSCPTIVNYWERYVNAVHILQLAINKNNYINFGMAQSEMDFYKKAWDAPHKRGAIILQPTFAN